MDKKTDSEKMTFEEALKRLETIVEEMESEDLAIEKMLKLFDEGRHLSNFCEKKLKGIEKNIEVLVKDNNKDGEWEHFDDSSTRKDAAFRQNNDKTDNLNNNNSLDLNRGDNDEDDGQDDSFIPF